MFNMFSGIRRETVVGVLHVACTVFLILSFAFPLIFILPNWGELISVGEMIGVAGIFLFCLFSAAALFGISFVVEDAASLVKAAGEAGEQESESPQFESRVKAIERREEDDEMEEPTSPGSGTAGSNGEDEGFLISLPKHAQPQAVPVPQAAQAPSSKLLPTAEAGKCFESVKTYVDLEMWPLAYQKAQELLQKWPDSPEATKVRKNLEYIRQRSEEIEVPVAPR